MNSIQLALDMKRLVELYGKAACESALNEVSQEDEVPAPSKMTAVTKSDVSGEEAKLLKSENSVESKGIDSLVHALLEASVDACFVTDESGTMELVNPSAIEMFGYETSDELLGDNIASVIGGGMNENVHTAYIRRAAATQFEDGNKKVSNDNDSSSKMKRSASLIAILDRMRDVPALRKDGSEFHVQVVIRKLEVAEKIYFVAFCHDLTRHLNQLQDIREQHQRVEHEKEMLKNVLDSCFESVIIMGSDCKISQVNQSALKEFGYENESDLVGQNVSVLVGDEGHAKRHDQYVRGFYKRRESKSTLLGKMRRGYMAKRRDGSIFPCQIGIRKVAVAGDDVDNKEGVLVGFIRNMSSELEAMQLAVEKTATEELLFNMLPPVVAQRLKRDPGHIADSFPTATILFADIVGFTSLSTKLEPIAVIALLNDLFCRFDNLMDVYGLNKIKTIGDCYMVTSIPDTSREQDVSCAAVCHFATDLIQAVQSYNSDNPDQAPLNVRVGINTGPVVAGVIGTKRFMYDVWGHAVNLASRMESTGTPGRIQVSPDVAACLGDRTETEFDLEHRGKVQVKGVGEVTTHFLTAKKGPVTSDPYKRAKATVSDDRRARMVKTLSTYMR